MKKIDFKKEYKEYYSPSYKEISRVTVPKWNFLKVDGAGDPNKSEAFQDAIQALYPVAYTLKFFAKRTLYIDYCVMPLEGLWWADDMSDYILQRKDKWKWTLMIMQPSVITIEHFRDAVETVQKKGKILSALSLLRFEPYNEGLSAQIGYIGTYANETGPIKRIHEYIEKEGCSRTGYHHEIYLSDTRRVAPEKQKIILRQPMENRRL